MKRTKQKNPETILLRVLMISLTLSAMSALMFNFVLADLRSEYHLTTAQVSWVSSSYLLLYGIGTAIYGKLADRFQLKNIVTFGLILSAAGSLVGLASQTFWMVLAGRCLQAIGAGAIPAISMLIPIRYFPVERRGYALGMVFVGISIGTAVGPIVSALVVGFVHWRWLFVFPMFILFTLPVYRKYLVDEKPKESGSFDWIGSILLAATVTLLLLGITAAWHYMIGGFITLVLFIVRIHSVKEPFVQPKTFHNKKYTFGLFIAFLINIASVSLPFLSPLLLTSVHHLSSTWTALAMVPAAICSALFGRHGGKLADKKGNMYVFVLASILLFVCFSLLSTFIGLSPIYLAVFLIFGNIGQSFIMIAMSNSISTTLSSDQAGVGMGILGMLNFITGGIASGIYGKLVDLHSTIAWNPANVFSNGSIFSNIFFILAILCIGIPIFYYFQFRTRLAENMGR